MLRPQRGKSALDLKAKKSGEVDGLVAPSIDMQSVSVCACPGRQGRAGCVSRGDEYTTTLRRVADACMICVLDEDVG